MRGCRSLVGSCFGRRAPDKPPRLASLRVSQYDVALFPVLPTREVAAGIGDREPSYLRGRHCSGMGQIRRLRIGGKSGADTRRGEPAGRESRSPPFGSVLWTVQGPSGRGSGRPYPSAVDVNKEDQPDRPVPDMPVEHGGRRLRMDETEPRALGLPLRWFRTTEPIDVRWVRHPYRWLRWRSEVRRRGPYAPPFEDFPRR